MDPRNAYVYIYVCNVAYSKLIWLRMKKILMLMQLTPKEF